MRHDQLKPDVMLRGPLFPEPVQVIATVPMGQAVTRQFDKAQPPRSLNANATPMQLVDSAAVIGLQCSTEPATPGAS